MTTAFHYHKKHFASLKEFEEFCEKAFSALLLPLIQQISEGEDYYTMSITNLSPHALYVLGRLHYGMEGMGEIVKHKPATITMYKESVD